MFCAILEGEGPKIFTIPTGDGSQTTLRLEGDYDQTSEDVHYRFSGIADQSRFATTDDPTLQFTADAPYFEFTFDLASMPRWLSLLVKPNSGPYPTPAIRTFQLFVGK